MEGGANIFGVFRVKNHDFTPKYHIFSNLRGARAGSAPLDPLLVTSQKIYFCSLIVYIPYYFRCCHAQSLKTPI